MKSNIVLGVGIMAVPERRERVDNLLESLGLAAAHVAWDERHDGHVPNWWRAVTIASAGTATHALILEDDAEPCRDFLAAAKIVAARYPERIVSFFSTSKTPRAPTSQLSLVLHHGFSDVAVMYPVSWLQALRHDFDARQDELAANTWQVGYGADELRMKLRPQHTMWCTYPSFVQHGCPNQSTLRHRLAHSLARPCLDTYTSALALDWSQL